MSVHHNVVISVVVPIYNEQDSIDELYSRLSIAVSKISDRYELIFVNDGSKDQSLHKLMALSKSDSRSFYINFSRNFGHQIAVTAGLDFSCGDVVVIIDADLQDPPELIPVLYEKHKEGFEVVYAKRKERKGETFFKRLTAKIFYRLMSRITAVPIPLDVGDFRLIDRKIVDCLKQMPEQNKFLRGQIAWLGFNQTAVEFSREERKHGATGYSVRKMIRFALDGITAFSDKPLTLVTQSGIIVSTFSFLVILYTLYGHFIKNETVDGWASLVVSTMFIGGVQLTSIGIIGLYISRINKNVINRPLYLVKETNLNDQKSSLS
jgi:glycosyltransferase involved in cell wall biosynthesis